MVKDIGSDNGPGDTVTAETTQLYVFPAWRDPMLMDGCDETVVRFLKVCVLFSSVSATR